MLISVVTAVFNRKELIGSAIETLRRQTFQDYEHIIQDGGSTDGTQEVLIRLSDERTRFESGPDKGIYDALNKGIQRARGNVIGLLHSDDEFASPLVLEKIARVMEDPEVDGVYGDLVYVAKDDPGKIIRYWRAGEFSRAKIRRGWMPPHPTLFLRARVFEEFGLYDDTMRISADYEAMVRWLYTRQVRVKYIPEILVKMRLGGASNRSLRQVYQKSREDLEVIRRHQIGGLHTLFGKNARKLAQLVVKPAAGTFAHTPNATRGR